MSENVVTLPAPPGTLAVYGRALLQRARPPSDAALALSPPVLRLAAIRPDPEHLRRYLAVCGGRQTGTLPLLYPHLLGFGLQMSLLTGPASPFPAMGLVHVANSVTSTRPIPGDAPLDVEVELAPPVPHRRGRTVDLLARVSVDGEVVWRSASTYLHREHAPSYPPGSTGVTGVTGATGATGADTRSEPDPDLLSRPGALWRLPADLGRRYGAVSGDRNPIHLSAPTARLFGFRTAIAHGMWTAARCLAALEGRVGDAVRNDVEFRQPIPLPGTVEFADLAGPDRVDFAVRSARPGRDGAPRLHLVGSLTAP